MTENGCAAAQEAAPSASTNGAAAAPVIVEQQLVAMPILQQDGEVFVGPGSLKEAELLGLGLRRLRTREKDDLANAKKFAQEVSVKAIMMRQQQNEQAKQQKIAMYQQALALMSRIYIGSISFEAREDHLRQVFGWYGPIKTINVQYDGSTGHHKGYAFLEYEVPEAAQLAINQLNGYLLCGRNLKVNAQTQQNQQQWAGAPTAPGVVAPLQNAQNIIQLVMQEAAQYHRIYVASVHPDLSETDLKSVFEAFGEVKNCRLARNLANPRVHRGFGYITYNNAQACREAVAGMNGFDLGGQQLRVGKAITPPDAISYLAPAATQALPSAAALAAAAITAKIQAQEAYRE